VLLVNVRLILDRNARAMHMFLAANAWFLPAQTLSVTMAIPSEKNARVPCKVFIRVTAICEMISAIWF
jgi:hypothetical protein